MAGPKQKSSEAKEETSEANQESSKANEKTTEETSKATEDSSQAEEEDSGAEETSDANEENDETTSGSFWQKTRVHDQVMEEIGHSFRAKSDAGRDDPLQGSLRRERRIGLR